MTSVWYLGASDIRVVYGRDWAAAGADPGTTTRWNAGNGYSLPASGFTASQLALLDSLPEFWTTAPDGPRTFPVPYDEVVTFAGLNRYLTDPANVPGLNKSTVGLAHVDDTADTVKPVSGPQAAAIAVKLTAPTGGTAGQVVTLNQDGSWGLSTPATGASVTPAPDPTVPSGTTYAVSGVGPFPLWADVRTLLGGTAALPPTDGTQGQVLQRDTTSSSGTSWATPAGASAAPAATATTAGVVRLAGDLAGTSAAPTLRQLQAAPTTVGSSTTIPQVTVDTAGRVTNVVGVAVALDQATVDRVVAALVNDPASAVGQAVRNASTGTAAPVLSNTVTPTLSGTAVQGSTLTVSNGTWTPTPDGFRYQWRRGGNAISGATAATYTIVGADVGAQLSATVTATRSGYTSTPAASATVTPTAATSFSALLTEAGDVLTTEYGDTITLQ